MAGSISTPLPEHAAVTPLMAGSLLTGQPVGGSFSTGHRITLRSSLSSFGTTLEQGPLLLLGKAVLDSKEQLTFNKINMECSILYQQNMSSRSLFRSISPVDISTFQ